MKSKLLVKLAVVLVVWLLGTVGVVRAHEITPKTSQPAAGQALDQAPGEVVLIFTEELVLNGSSLQVFDAGGKQVDLGGGGLDLTDAQHASMRVKLNPLKEGVYTVKWKVKLLDGDSTDGSYHFGVGKVQVPAEVLADDGVDAPQPGSGGKSPNAGSSTSPLIWIAAVVAAVAVLGVIFVLLRKKNDSQKK